MKSWHRYYDPETGRYISADPIGLAGGMNLYAYVDGNAINWIDFNGLEIIGRWITMPSVNPWSWWVGLDMTQFEFDYDGGGGMAGVGKWRFGYAPLHVMLDVRFHIQCEDTCTQETWDIKRENYISESLGRVPVKVNIRPRSETLAKILGWEIEHSGTIEAGFEWFFNNIDNLVEKAKEGWGIANKTPTEICKMKRK